MLPSPRDRPGPRARTRRPGATAVSKAREQFTCAAHGYEPTREQAMAAFARSRARRGAAREPLRALRERYFSRSIIAISERRRLGFGGLAALRPPAPFQMDQQG
jgi:hypothetical protein